MSRPKIAGPSIRVPHRCAVVVLLAAVTLPAGALPSDGANLVAAFSVQPHASWDGSDPCTGPSTSDWSGIVCTGGAVTAVSLASRGLTGSVAWGELAGVSQLREFYIHDNRLTGTLVSADWASICALSQLQSFNIAVNQFSGTLVSADWARIGALLQLVGFSIGGNRFSGTLVSADWTKIGALSQLRYFYIHSNQFSGTLLSAD